MEHITVTVTTIPAGEKNQYSQKYNDIPQILSALQGSNTCQSVQLCY